MSRQIKVGKLLIGGGAPIVVQSMCNTLAEDAESTLAQIGRLADVGCQLIRVALPRPNAVEPFRKICASSVLPVIADIHFDCRLALAALDAGAAGIRVNPGNMDDQEGLREIARRAAASGQAVRIGVNLGSLSPRARSAYGRSAKAMVESAREFLGVFEDAGCENLKVSLKASDLPLTVEACRLFHESSDWPLHLGVTEAGTPAQGVVKSAIGIGALLLDGIGDTIRVSLTAPPEMEIPAAFRILDALGLRSDRPQIISCPTCGRTHIGLIELAENVENAVNGLLAQGYRIPLKKIAVMGCEVNGPGEASDADVGIAGGHGFGILFKNGQRVRSMPEAELLDALMQEIRAVSFKA